MYSTRYRPPAKFMPVPRIKQVCHSVAPSSLPRRSLLLGMLGLVGLLAGVVIAVTTDSEPTKPGVLIRKKGRRPGDVVTELITTLNTKDTITQDDVQGLLDHQVERDNVNLSVDVLEVHLPEAIILDKDAFEDCLSLTKVRLPNVTFIDLNVFTGCTALVHVELPKVEVIRDGAFQNCVSLRKIALPRLVNIPVGCFMGCTSLVAVDFPDVTSVADDAFRDCYRLGETREVYFKSNITWSSITGDDVGTSLGRAEARIVDGDIVFDH